VPDSSDLTPRSRRVAAAALRGPATAVAGLARRFAAEGHALALVGGSVRDVFLGRRHGDLDLATDARPGEMRRIAAGWADTIWDTGIEFGTVGLRKGSLETLRSILKRSVTRAQARDKVKRNVVMLCEIPKGRPGRPSKALTLEQAEEVLAVDDGTPMHAYVVASLLTGARTEEMRGLRWDHVVAYDEQCQAWMPVTEAGWGHKKFAIYVWRSVRASGDTKTKKSRRSLALPKRAAEALRGSWDARPAESGGSGLVFCTAAGMELDKDTVRRAFRRVLAGTSLDPAQWTPRELRHNFVSLLDDANVPIEKISRLVGHADTTTTETVYRFQIRPVIQDGATAMDEIFPDDDDAEPGPL
jgi:integrase